MQTERNSQGRARQTPIIQVNELGKTPTNAKTPVIRDNATSAPNLAAEDTAPRTAGAAMAEVQLPATLSAEAATGKTYFDAVCASCHGANAAGQDGVAPPLVHQLYEPSHHGDEAFLVAARIGVRAHHWPFASMPPLEQKLTDGELAAIIRYVRELQRENGIL